MPQSKLRSADSVSPPCSQQASAAVKSMTAMAASAAARVVVATASLEHAEPWNHMRDVKMSCQCDDEKCRRANSAEESRCDESAAPRSFSPLRLLAKRGSRPSVKNCKTPTSTPTAENPPGEAEEEECHVEGCFLHSPQAPQAPAAAAAAAAAEKERANSGASSTASSAASLAGSTVSETRKWRASLKFNAFRNSRQQTFHSLDMYVAQPYGHGAAAGGGLPATTTMSALDKCVRMARRTDSISQPKDVEFAAIPTQNVADTLPMERVRIQSMSPCPTKGRAAKYSAPSDVPSGRHFSDTRNNSAT